MRNVEEREGTGLAKDHESGLELGSPEVAHKAIGVFDLKRRCAE